MVFPDFAKKNNQVLSGSCMRNSGYTAYRVPVADAARYYNVQIQVRTKRPDIPFRCGTSCGTAKMPALFEALDIKMFGKKDINIENI